MEPNQSNSLVRITRARIRSYTNRGSRRSLSIPITLINDAGIDDLGYVDVLFDFSNRHIVIRKSDDTAYEESVRTRNNLHRKRHRLRYPDREAARGAVTNAIAAGKLIPEPCEMCGKKKTQAHHDDYSKPLDVTWLCGKCHRFVTAQARRRRSEVTT